MTDANRNLLIRLLSAAVLAPLLVGVILWPRPEPMAIFIHLCVVIGLIELYWITLREDALWMRLCGVALGLLLSITIYWCPSPAAFQGALIATTLIVLLLYLARFGELRSAAARAALMLFGLLYVPLLLTSLALLKRLPDGADWVFLALTITWFSDTGAYFAGRALGRRKLYPAVSPGKSVEGAIGGLLASAGAALLAKGWYMPQLSWLDVALVSLPAGALGQAGDLVESLIKRGYQVKDSGWIIPGHGGLLDRIDALLFSAPFVYLYARFVFSTGAS